MFGWIITIVFICLCLFFIARCSPVLFGIVAALPAIYLGIKYDIFITTIAGAIIFLVTWNIFSNVDKNLQHRLHFLTDGDKNKVSVFLKSFIVVFHVWGWALDIGFIASIFFWEYYVGLDKYDDKMMMYSAENLAFDATLFMVALTILMYVLLFIKDIRKNRQT